MIDAVLFDKDGTLFDFRASWGGWARAYLTSIARDAAHAAAMGRAIGYDMASGQFARDSVVIAATSAEIAAALLPHLPGKTQGEISAHINATAAGAAMSQAVPLKPLLAALKARGLKVGLATNDFEAAARAHLAAHDITAYFDFIAGYDSGHGAKPGPGMCLGFARAVGVDAARIAMVGDSTHDLEAGRAAGMRTIAVLTGIAGAEELRALSDVVLPDIGDIPGWLDQLSAA
ncbi:MAG: HAD family hydrolase [Pseudomonadota bacterium]